MFKHFALAQNITISSLEASSLQHGDPVLATVHEESDILKPVVSKTKGIRTGGRRGVQ